MAYSAVTAFKTVFGNKRAVGLTITADAASGAVDSGLSVIEMMTVSPKSAATAAPLMKMNQNSAATALNGSIFIKNAANGDDFFALVIGH